MEAYIKDFFAEVKVKLDLVDWKEIARAIKLLHATYDYGGRVFIIGNGGSAAISSHFANDLNKTILGHKGDEVKKRFQAMALSDNVPVLTAWANDMGYEHVFSEQLKNFIQDTDILVAISSSGNSPNIIKAAEVAKENRVPIIALVGFDGGALMKMANAKVLVPSFEYTIVEGLHTVITHLIIKYFYESFKEEAGRSVS